VQGQQQNNGANGQGQQNGVDNRKILSPEFNQIGANEGSLIQIDGQDNWHDQVGIDALKVMEIKHRSK